MKLILIRHGQTEWNVQRRAQGQTDIPMDENGLRQARAVARRLRTDNIDGLYTSPLSRAHVTAAEIGALIGIEPIVMPELTEIQFGLWEGRTFNELKAIYPALFEQWSAAPYGCRAPQAETLEEILFRVRPVVRRIAAYCRNAVIVSHTLPLKLIIADAIGLDFNRIHHLKLDNCGYTLLNMDNNGQGSLMVMNDISHMRGAAL